MTMPITIGSIPKAAVEHIGRVGAQQDEGGLGDVGDVEHAERDRDADADRRIEAAEQDAGDDRVDQQIERNAHRSAAGNSALPPGGDAQPNRRRDPVAHGHRQHAGLPPRRFSLSRADRVRPH